MSPLLFGAPERGEEAHVLENRLGKETCGIALLEMSSNDILLVLLQKWH